LLVIFVILQGVWLSRHMEHPAEWVSIKIELPCLSQI
jgi:hypothetical protein